MMDWRCVASHLETSMVPRVRVRVLALRLLVIRFLAFRVLAVILLVLALVDGLLELLEAVKSTSVVVVARKRFIRRRRRLRRRAFAERSRRGRAVGSETRERTLQRPNDRGDRDASATVRFTRHRRMD